MILAKKTTITTGAGANRSRASEALTKLCRYISICFNTQWEKEL
jgi:thiamine pyrophosphate-dependent acetolactate synthase large subunit-like protein